MITLYAFGPAFGLPDPSPFVTKAEVLLKMSGLAYRVDNTGFRRAPKGKLPYIDDGDERVADSTFIRWHLEHKYQIDFEKGLSTEQRAIGWAFEKMAEDNLYWALVDARWFDDANFAKGPKEFFQKIPAPVRRLMIAFIRRRLKRTLNFSALSRSSWAANRPASMQPFLPSLPARCVRTSIRHCAPPLNAATISGTISDA
jgi:glutathione S-transferase